MLRVLERHGLCLDRMDKYYMIVRKYVYASFLLLIGLEWEEELVKQYNSILTDQGGPLCLTDSKIPTSLLYHLGDIYLEELEKALKESDPCCHAPLSALLGPFVDIMACTNSNITFKRLCGNILEPILDALNHTLGEEDENNSPQEPPPKRVRLSSLTPDYTYLCQNVSGSFSNKPESPQIVLQRILQDCFQAASRSDTRDSNRRKLYTIWRTGMQDTEELALDAT